MSKYESDPEDPLEGRMVGLSDPTGESVRAMAETFADEFLRLGHAPREVMDLFRATEYGLAHRAWGLLGEVATFLIVAERDRFWSDLRRARARRAELDPAHAASVAEVAHA